MELRSKARNSGRTTKVTRDGQTLTAKVLITVCLGQEFHSRTCTELSLWGWTPYYTPQWSKEHQSPSNEWCWSQCWIGTNPAAHHQREATPQHCQHRRWGTCWHQGTGVLWKWQCAFLDVRVCTHLSLSPTGTLHLLQKTWARKESLWSALQRSRAWMFLTSRTSRISGSHQA